MKSHCADFFFSLYCYYFRTYQNKERAGTTWKEQELPGTSWNHLEREVTHQRTDTEKQEIHRKKMYVQYHCSIEYKISNSYCNKKHHLRYLKLEPPGAEWSQ